MQREARMWRWKWKARRRVTAGVLCLKNKSKWDLQTRAKLIIAEACLQIPNLASHDSLTLHQKHSRHNGQHKHKRKSNRGRLVIIFWLSCKSNLGLTEFIKESDKTGQWKRAERWKATTGRKQRRENQSGEETGRNYFKNLGKKKKSSGRVKSGKVEKKTELNEESIISGD